MVNFKFRLYWITSGDGIIKIMSLSYSFTKGVNVMSINLNEITPQDFYIIKLEESMELKEIAHMIDLYQPIIGVDGIGLYFTLLNHIPLGQAGHSAIHLHRNLMSQMHLSFQPIIKARKVLEAIGLLRTTKYKHKDKNEYIFEYSLKKPLNPFKFFQSDVLNLLLLNRLGEMYYRQLKEKLIVNKDWKEDYFIELMDITKSFDEIFDTVLASEIKGVSNHEIQNLLQPLSLDKEKDSTTLSIKNKYVDIEFIQGMVSDIFQLHKSFDEHMITTIQELAFLYHLSEMDIIDLLKDHTIYDELGKIDEELLRERVREKYQYEKKEVMVLNKNNLTEKAKQQLSHEDKESKHKWYLENYSPIDLFRQYQNGGKIPSADLKLIEDLLHEYKLPSVVVNVLIEYIMYTNDRKFPRSLVEKIAGHWKRLKIKTVEEAQAAARKEHQMYKEWKTGGNRSKTEANGSKGVSKGKKEKIPDYILQQEKKYHQKDQKPEEESDEKTKKEINKLLKELGEV